MLTASSSYSGLNSGVAADGNPLAFLVLDVKCGLMTRNWLTHVSI
jgi:hypothetical protein